VALDPPTRPRLCHLTANRIAGNSHIWTILDNADVSFEFAATVQDRVEGAWHSEGQGFESPRVHQNEFGPFHIFGSKDAEFPAPKGVLDPQP
jgi:hypothetical protein